MRHFQGKKRWQKLLESAPFLAIIGLTLLVFAWGVIRLAGQMNNTAKNLKISENKIAELEKARLQLSSDISKLKTEEGVEQNIRERFGLIKEGEELIVVVDDKSEEVAPKDEKNWFTSMLSSWFK